MLLVMANAGGHGTDQTIKQYTSYLLTKYNIDVIHQVPRSSYIDNLDMGMWCALQAAVDRKKITKRFSIAVLVNLIHDMWANETLNKTIAKVFKKLDNIIVLIDEGKGGSHLVKKKRS